MKRVTKAVGALCLLTFAVVMNSQSAVAADSNWYGGFNLGSTKAKIDDARIVNSLQAGGFVTTGIANDDRRLAYKLFAGYRLNTYFALEGGYYNLGRSSFTATTTAGTLVGNIRLRGYNFDAVVILPIVAKFSVFARGGFIWSEARDHFTGTGAVVVINPEPSRGAPSYKWGAGVQYDFTQSLGLRAEAERYRVNDAVGNKGEVDLYSAGLIVKF